MSTTMIQRNDRLSDYDCARHNDEVRQVWQTYRERNPVRVPMILGTNTRYFMFNPAANPQGLTFKAYTDDPDVMFDAQLSFKRWSRFNLLQDAELGEPDAWEITVDFQNFYEAGWFGCPIEFMDDQVPDTHPAFEDRPEAITDNGLPDPFGGLLAKGLTYYQHFKARAASETYLGKPIKIRVPVFGTETDGPFTVACNLCSPSTICMMMIEEPEKLRELLAFITDANIARVKAWRKLAGVPETPVGGIADDSIALISLPMYVEHVLPHHQRYCDALFAPKNRTMHLCGDATRHFVCIRDELNVRTFDTGFPFDFRKMRTELGPDVQINGGPHVELLVSGSPQMVRAETERILRSGIMEGGRFVLREGNNLAPDTPVENTEMMYATCRSVGRFR